jgi:hypothetical protein
MDVRELDKEVYRGADRVDKIEVVDAMPRVGLGSPTRLGPHMQSD